MPDRLCSIDGCGKGPVKGRGWCTGHYARWRLTGSVGGLIPDRDPLVRFWAKVDKRAPVSEARPDLGRCWIWTAKAKVAGYGYFRGRDGRNVVAHRFAYQLLVGPIPDGMVLDHLCRVRACVNPAHLEVVTEAENIRRGMGPTAINARKTHCSKGHLYDDANTYRTTRGYRRCRTCTLEQQRSNRKRRAA